MLAAAPTFAVGVDPYASALNTNREASSGRRPQICNDSPRTERESAARQFSETRAKTAYHVAFNLAKGVSGNVEAVRGRESALIYSQCNCCGRSCLSSCKRRHCSTSAQRYRSTCERNVWSARARRCRLISTRSVLHTYTSGPGEAKDPPLSSGRRSLDPRLAGGATVLSICVTRGRRVTSVRALRTFPDG